MGAAPRSASMSGVGISATGAARERSAMPDSLLIDALIRRWEECRARGEERSTEDLCRDHPELVETLPTAIARLSVGPAGTEQPVMDAPTTPGDDPDRTLDRDDAVADGPRTGVRCFGDYELEQELARGGWASSTRRGRSRSNRTVALKMILAGQLASEAEVRRFHARGRGGRQPRPPRHRADPRGRRA